MYYNKNLNHKMTLRLTDELYEYVNQMSDTFTLTPSDFIRQVIAQHKDQREMAQQIVNQMGNKLMEGFENGKDRKADQYDNVQH